MLAMPPRAPLTGSFAASEENNVVVCPLRNHDGSACRKRCTGEKRYRSMQEHIRRAHPEHYISKLPATEQSFRLMVDAPPHPRQPAPAMPSSSDADYTSSAPAATAAAALASLHNYRAEFDWDSEPDAPSETDRPRARFAPTTLEQHFASDEPYYTSTSIHRELLPSSLAHSPPGRSSTLPPAPRSVKPNRPRKSSVTQHARRGKHERQKSREHTRPLSFDRKAFSAEPQTAAAIMGKRWEDLIDAAASATEEDSRDLTPVPHSPHHSPHANNRTSLPPFATSHFQSYTASPLQNTLTPPPPDMSDLQPFPSVESSIESAVSGHGFHIPSQGLSDSSPTYPYPVQIYCAACRKLSVLRDSFACSECICGFCHECVHVLVSEQTRGRATRCPRCNAVGGKFKPFQLDIR